MTDPEAALRETLSDDVLASAYWAFHRARGGLGLPHPSMRDVLVAALLPLLTPRAWQPMMDWLDEEIRMETERASEARGHMASMAIGASEALQRVKEKLLEHAALPPAPKETER